MRGDRFVLSLTLVGLVALSAASSRAQDKTSAPKEFTQKLRQLTDDPNAPNADALAKDVAVFVTETKLAEVILEKEEFDWFGDPKTRQGPLLLTAYIGGNTQAQLDSGHRGNDIYPGLLTMFRTYRALREKDKDYKVEAVEKLLKLQAEGKLLKYVLDLENKRRPKKEL